MLATILKKRRQALNLTQQAVAEQLHTTRQTISNWETGKNYPDVPMLIAISKLYELSLDEMLKTDANYVQKVTADYEIINHAKKWHWIDLGLLITMLSIGIILLIRIFFSHFMSESMTGILILIATVCLMIFTYFKTCQFYPAVPNTKQPLIIPKTTGIGITINPNNPIGKVIWVLMILFLVIGLLSTILK